MRLSMDIIQQCRDFAEKVRNIEENANNTLQYLTEHPPVSQDDFANAIKQGVDSSLA